MEEEIDYDVNTKVSFLLNFNGSGDFNLMLLPDVQREFINHVKEVYEQDEIGSYVFSDLNFRFNGRRVDLEYTFTCSDLNPAEAESFSRYCVQRVQEQLEAFGCKLLRTKCSAEEADLTWFDQLEDAIFGPRNEQPQQGGMEMM